MSFDFSSAADAITNPLSYFSNRSEEYSKYRPSYPDTAINTILLGFDSPSQLVAADIGAGTGIGAQLLAERGVRVMAIEPNAEMRTAAIAHERVEFLAGTAEQIPLENASVDLVTSFQAFHWFDFNQSLQEFRRILKTLKSCVECVNRSCSKNSSINEKARLYEYNQALVLRTTRIRLV